MSYQSMGWAIEQAVSSPATRCVIMSIANHVGGDGHGWVYQDTIARESCMSVDTVQRRVPELIEAGYVRRIKLKRFGRRTHDYYVLARSSLFGAPLDEIRPFLPASCDVIEEADHGAEAESPTDTETEMSTLPEADATAICGSVTLPHPAVDATALVRQQERILNEVRTIPKPLSEDERGFQKNSIEDEKTEKRWERFRTGGYPDGVIDIVGARREFGKLSEDEQDAAIVGIAAYKDYCRARGQKNPKPAHLYLRKKVWSGLAAMASVDGTPLVTSHSPHSEAGRALIALASIAGHSLFRLPNGNISYVNPVTPQLLALANVPPLPQEDWIECELGSHNFAAWRDLIYRIFAGRTLRSLTKYRVPWRWPPAVDGKTYAGTDPPGELSDADAQALTGT